jgi:cell wall-associated NlpC family hydrolase
MRWGRPGTAATACAAAALAAVALLGTAVPAQADHSLASARAKAARLAALVDHLSAESEMAAEDYGAADDQLGQVVTALILAQGNLDAATQDADAQVAHADDVAAQMYMAGGPSALYASVLDGRSISDALDRIASVNAVVRGDIVATAQSHAQVRTATAARAQLALLTARRSALQAKKAALAAKAARLEEQARAALLSADADVRRLVDEARRAAELAAARTAAASLPWVTTSVPADSYAAIDRALAEAGGAPATPYAVSAIADARRWLGTPYSAGGGNLDGPTTGWCSSSAPDDGRTADGTCAATSTVGFDCSSLMVRIFHAAGRALPRTSRQQWKIGVHVPLTAIAPGDLLFWANDTGNPASIHHVAMYLGHGLMVQAPHTGGHVEVSPVYLRGLIGAVRPS